MIISSSRISSSSGSGGVGAHVFSGPKNESIELVQGARSELDDMVSDARSHGAKYAIRHFKISPEQAMTRDQALIVASDLGREFGFNPNSGVLVEHQKPRAGGKGFDHHWHFMVPEVDPIKGRVLSDKWSRPRQEKIARLAEIQFGHDQVRGKWSASIERSLRDEGRTELADKIAPLAAGETPRESYTSLAHQQVQRKKLSLPELKNTVAELWTQADSGKAFQSALVDNGIFIRHGDKKNAWIAEAISPDGEIVFLGSVARLTKSKPADVQNMLSEIGQHAETKTEEKGLAEEKDEGFALTPEISALPKPQPGPELQPTIISPQLPEPSPVSTVEPASEPSAPAGESLPSKPIGPAKSAPSHSGGGVAGGGGDDNFVAPIDPSKPDDWQRFLSQSAAAAKKKAAKLAAAGGNHKAGGPDPKKIRAFFDELFNSEGNYDGHNQTASQLARGGRDSSGHNISGGVQKPAQNFRSERANADQLRGNVSGEGRSRSSGTQAAFGSTETGRAEQNGSSDRAAGADCAEPSQDGTNTGPAREDAPADRVRARREAKAFAETAGRNSPKLKLLAERLAGTPDRIAREERRENITKALVASRERVAGILAKAPFPDPSSRLADALSVEERQRVRAALADAKTQAVTARQAAEDAKSRQGLLGKLGIPTRDRAEAKVLENEAEKAGLAAEQAERDLAKDLVDADARSEKRAEYRESKQDQWEASRPVRAALEEEHANKLVVSAIKAGDEGIEKLAGSDIAKAREEVLKREAEQRSEQARRAREAKDLSERLKLKTAASVQSTSPAPAPGPRMR